MAIKEENKKKTDVYVAAFLRVPKYEAPRYAARRGVHELPFVGEFSIADQAFRLVPRQAPPEGHGGAGGGGVSLQPRDAARVLGLDAERGAMNLVNGRFGSSGMDGS